MHEDDPDLGATRTGATIARDVGRLGDLHANYVRLAHYPHDVRFLRAARDAGILLGEEIPNYQTGIGLFAAIQEGEPPWDWPVGRFGMRQLADPELRARAQQQLVEMIERDVNNPAIALWGVANETFTLSPDAGR